MLVPPGLFSTGTSLYFWLDLNLFDVPTIGTWYIINMTVSRYCMPTIWTCLLTVRGCYSRFLTKSYKAAANRKWFFGADGSSCVQGDCSVVAYCLRMAQLVRTVGHTEYRTGKLLPVAWHYGENAWTQLANLEQPNSSKNLTDTLETATKHSTTCYEPPFGKRSKTTGSTSPDLVCDVG